MKDFDGMTQEEILEWSREQREKSRKQFEGVPVPRISETKRNDYPHWEQVGWVFRLRQGSRARIGRNGGEDEGTLHGLRPVTDDGPLALVVELDDGVWALRRADGVTDWADTLDARDTTVKELAVPVTAWEVSDVPGPTDAVAPAVGRTQTWTIRTTRLDDDEQSGTR
jgi:hypothetical protein